MARFLLNPTFDIETGKLLSHDGEFFEEPVMLFDRGAAKNANTLETGSATTTAQATQNANQDRSSVIPGIIQAANHPQGFTPEQQNNMLVKQQEAAGGGNAAITGEGNLAALRSRTAGGYTPALSEAARAKGRTLATGALDVANRNAEVQQQQQQQARNQLLGLYGTDTSNMLHSMGIQSQDLQDQLAANRQGWLQNTEGVLDTLSKMGRAGERQ
jgi:hypothetical protein